MNTTALAAPASRTETPWLADGAALLSARVAELAAVARERLGPGAVPADRALVSARLDAELTEIAVRIADRVATQPYDPATSAGAAALLSEVGALQDEVRREARTQPYRALDRVRAAIEDLRGASATELVEAVSAGLCAACDFDRAMISHVSGSTWIPHRLHVATEPTHPSNVALREFSRDARIPLVSAMYETELVRRRAPALISDARDGERTFRPVVELSGSRSYVVVPLTVSGVVVGFFHADTFSTGRPLSDQDRDAANAFADGFGLLFERTIHADRLARGRSAAGTAFTEARQGSQVLVDAPPTLPVPSAGRAGGRPARAAAPATRESAAADDAPALPAVRLTARELEVLAILATGRSNDQIAAELVIAQSTVKTHLKHIMRKLGAANRAEAVSMYLRLSRTTRWHG